MHHPTDRIAHTTAFVTPVVEHWLEREIAQWVHPMKDRSDDPSHDERTLLPRSYISLPTHRRKATHCRYAGQNDSQSLYPPLYRVLLKKKIIKSVYRRGSILIRPRMIQHLVILAIATDGVCGGGGGVDLFTCSYPLKVQVCPPLD